MLHIIFYISHFIMLRLKVWDPFKRKHRTISGYGSLRFEVVNQLFLVEEGAKAILLAGEHILPNSITK